MVDIMASFGLGNIQEICKYARWRVSQKFSFVTKSEKKGKNIVKDSAISIEL